jgi:hypothetical protein
VWFCGRRGKKKRMCERVRCVLSGIKRMNDRQETNVRSERMKEGKKEKGRDEGL